MIVVFSVEPENVPERAALMVGDLVETLVARNMQLLAARPTFPKLALSLVAYVANPLLWQDAVSCLKAGKGSCQDLAAWRIAELRLSGEPDAGVHVEVRETETGPLHHVTVRRGDGRVEDPTKRLALARADVDS
jgi:hypothetical protein